MIENNAQNNAYVKILVLVERLFDHNFFCSYCDDL